MSAFVDKAAKPDIIINVEFFMLNRELCLESKISGFPDVIQLNYVYNKQICFCKKYHKIINL
ncbi:hypothetical protein NIES2100_70030 [Calothrix sp. NIES-2100]|nr:hypothetical protein NIES2100_70030 [Calothrix sp. NIES-2100]